MRIVITGGAGYLGKSIYRALMSMDVPDISVRCMSRHYHPYIEKYDFEHLDVLDPDATVNALKGADAVINLASVPYVAQVREELSYARLVNIEGMRNVLIGAEGAEKVIFVSSSGIYGAQEGRIDEESRLDPVTEYTRQKVQAEEMVRSSGIPYSILRASNLYGYGVDYPPQPLVHKMIDSALKEGVIHVSSGKIMRNFLHVDDCAEAVVGSLLHAEANRTYNVGNEDLSLSDVAELIRSSLGRRDRRIDIEVKEPGEAVPFEYVHDKIAKDLGYSPRIGIKDGIDRILDHLLGPT